MSDLHGTKWRERDQWSGERVIEVTNHPDGDAPDAVIEAVVVTNTGSPLRAGKPLARPIKVATLVKRWSKVEAE
jgi:hypothetical protein